MRVKELHDSALELADEAFFYRSRGEEEKAVAYFKDALVLEREAARLAAAEKIGQPTESVLYRSAASLALNAGDHAEVEKLVSQGLTGYPPPEIAGELRELYFSSILQSGIKPRKENPENLLINQIISDARAIRAEKFDQDIPPEMAEIIRASAVSLGSLGFTGSLLPGSDMVNITAVWVAMTLKLAEKSGKNISNEAAKKIALAVCLGAGAYLTNAKIRNTGIGWIASAFTFGISLFASATANAAMNSSFTFAYGRAIARYFLQVDTSKDTLLTVNTVIALIGQDMGFDTPHDDLLA